MPVTYTNSAGYTATPNANATPAQIAAGESSLSASGFSSAGGGAEYSTFGGGITPQQAGAIISTPQTVVQPAVANTSAPVNTSTSPAVGLGGAEGTTITPTANPNLPTSASSIPGVNAINPYAIGAADANGQFSVNPNYNPNAPSTNSGDLTAKYSAIHQQAVASGQSPDQGGTARSTIDDLSQGLDNGLPGATDQVNAAYNTYQSDVTSLNTAEANLGSVQTYQDTMSQALGIPALQLQAADLNTLVSGGGNKVNIENMLLSAGQGVSEAGVEGLTATANQATQLQLTNVQNALLIAQNNLSMAVSGYQADQGNVVNALKDKVTNDSNNLSLYQSAQSQIATNYGKVLTAAGWTGVATLLAGNPTAQAQFEQSQGVPAGTLSDPAKVAKLQALTYAQQRLSQATTRIDISAGNIPTTGTGNTAGTTPNVIPANAQPTDIVANSGGMTVAAVQQAATQYMLTGSMGSGTSGGVPTKGKASVLNESAVIQSELGLTDDQVVQLRESYKADLSSLTKLQTTSDASQAFESTALKNIQYAQSLSSTVPRTGSPLANNYDLWVKGQLSGDPATVKYETAVYTAANEYARVMAAAGASSGAITDSARNESNSILSASYTPDQLNAVFSAMQNDMSNKISSYGSQINDIINRTVGAQTADDGTTTAGGVSFQGSSYTAGQYVGSMNGIDFTANPDGSNTLVGNDGNEYDLDGNIIGSSTPSTQ